MGIIIYAVAAVGIATIVVCVYFVWGNQEADLGGEEAIRKELSRKLPQQNFPELLLSPSGHIALALNLDESQAAVIYAHGIHINVEPLSPDFLQQATVEESEQELTLQLQVNSFDRPKFELSFPK